MTGKKDWFVKISRPMKNKVKFMDDTTLAAERISDVLIERRDGKCSLIKDVLYILEIKCNLLCIGQFLDKDNKIHMENKTLHVMDANRVLILKVPMVSNRTFKIELKVMEHMCISMEDSREEWIRNYHLGHLNFRDLNALQNNRMVTEFPLINTPAEICEECVQAKQHKSKISKDEACKTKHHLEVVYSDICEPTQV